MYSFHVDHILPEKRHEGSNELYNLAWSCFDCNTTKSGEISGYDKQSGDLTPLYNPRNQIWDDHFLKDGPLIVGKTAIGRVTVRILDMNNPEMLELREALIALGVW